MPIGRRKRTSRITSRAIRCRSGLRMIARSRSPAIAMATGRSSLAGRAAGTFWVAFAVIARWSSRRGGLRTGLRCPKGRQHPRHCPDPLGRRAVPPRIQSNFVTPPDTLSPILVIEYNRSAAPERFPGEGPVVDATWLASGSVTHRLYVPVPNMLRVAV